MERPDVQEQTVAASDILSSRWSADGAYEKETRGVEKKLRLFGFEVDPYTNNGRCLQPFQGPHGFGFYGSPAFYDHSSYVPEFTSFGESQISFNHYDQNAFMNGYLNGPLVSKSYPVPSHVPVQQDNCKFNLIRSHGSHENKPAAIRPSPIPVPKQSCKSLDLQLGLNAQSNRSRSGL